MLSDCVELYVVRERNGNHLVRLYDEMRFYYVETLWRKVDMGRYWCNWLKFDAPFLDGNMAFMDSWIYYHDLTMHS